MISRTIRPLLEKLFKQYPVVTLTGPRQSGKTTLCRTAFLDLPYVNLEAPDQRAFATEDPRGFLARFDSGVILDEIQHAPDLPSYIQVLVDEKKKNGLFLLTGSQQLLLNSRISQSLAGRTALLRLLPLSLEELHDREISTEQMIHSGFYPRIFEQGLSPTQMLADYFETYVERDVRQVLEIRNLLTFRSFLKLCAGRVGQLLNVSNLGDDAGVSHTTAREWLSVLEASFIVFRLPPLHANLRKRLTKAPKLYFYDVGLASYLLGIESADQVFSHPLRGNLFENLVVAETLKWHLNRGSSSQLHFYRDSSGFEIDLVQGNEARMLALEIKSARTTHTGFFDALRKFQELRISRDLQCALVYGGEDALERQGIRQIPARRVGEALTDLMSSPS